MKNKIIVIAAAGLFLFSAGFAQVKLKTGIWRGALKTASGNDLPFNFEVKDTAGRQQLAIINGAERFKVTDVKVAGDSVFITMPLFDSEFKLRLDGCKLVGKWIRHLGLRDAAIDFSAEPDAAWRFVKAPEKPAFNVSGRWTAIFGEGADRDTTVGEFKQNGDYITGTFLTTTGDYRYLQGTVSGNKLYLSCFDGGHAFLFLADITNEKTLSNGMFYSGYSGHDAWTAVKNPNAKLPDAYSLTALKPGYKKLGFTFTDLNGNKVSLTDERFKNKVVIIQFMGSWCPNCMDETSYLVNYYKKYHPRGVEIIGLAYERTTDFAKSKKTLTQLKNRFDIPYTLLVTGFTNNKAETAKSIPMLANFVAFPTTVIVDKKGDVRKIHTGYSGPGTGEHYFEFVNEFEKLTDDLLAEK